MTSSAKLKQNFANSAEQSIQVKKKRLPPLSIRLSPDERAHLEAMAGNQPIGTFIKGRLFAANDNIPPKPRGHAPVKDHQALARILGVLSRLDVFLTIKGLLKVMQSGQVKLKPETEQALQKACADIVEIRRLLITALGIKAE